MKLFVLFIIFSNGIGEKLADYRRSCSENVIFLKNEKYWKTEAIPLDKNQLLKYGLVENDWEKAVQHECEDKRSKSNQKSKTDGSSLKNNTDASDPLIGKMKEMWKHEIFRNQIVNNYPTVNNNTLPKEISKVLLKSIVPEFTIGCADNVINAKYEMVSVEKIDAWKCEDIGEAVDDVYEYYDISPYWMFTKTDNRTYFIKEKLCEKNTLLCSIDSIETVDCTVNNLENCRIVKVRQVMFDNSNSSSHVRQLPGGVAAYGTFQASFGNVQSPKTFNFQSQISYPDDDAAPPPKEITIEKGLYYFSYTDG